MALLDVLSTKPATTAAINYSDTEEDTGYSALPSYMVAANTHTVLGTEGEFSFTDPSTWYKGLQNGGMFAVASATSGVAALYNSGVSAANFFGADYEEMDVAATLANIDSNLGEFYLENKQYADIAGFVMGAFVPGGLAMKAINTAKTTGLLGGNLAKATNLLVPETDNLIKLAGKELANRQSAFKVFDKTVATAFAKGVQGAFVESAIVEAAVTATMFKSPVLEDSDWGDISSNIFWGGAFGGAVGGAFSAARIYGGVKKLVNSATTGKGSMMDITLETAIPSTAMKSDAIIIHTADAERFATAKLRDELLPADSADRILTEATIERTRNNSINELSLKKRLGYQSLAAGDSELANTVADYMEGASLQVTRDSLLGLDDMGRVGRTLKGEVKAREAAKMDALDLAAGLDEAATSADVTHKIGYVKLLGENTGQPQWVKPIITRVADTVSTASQVAKKVASYGFTPTSKMAYKGVDADAMYIWAAKNVSYRKGMVVDGEAIPVLQALEKKLARSPEFELYVNVRGTTEKVTATGAVREVSKKQLITSPAQLSEYRRQVQEQTAMQLLKQDKRSIEEISAITNLSEKFLLGQRKSLSNVSKTRALSSDVADYDARTAANIAYTDMLRAKGLHSSNEIIDTSTRPQWAKVSYNLEARELPDSFEMDAMSFIQSKWKMYQQTLDNAVSAVVGDAISVDRIVKIDADAVMQSANRFDASAGYLASTNAGYDSLGSSMQYLGRATQDLTDAFRKQTDDTLSPAMFKFLSEPEAAYEFAAVNKLVQQSPEPYVYLPDSGELIPLKLKRWMDKGMKGEPPEFAEGVRESIAIARPAAREAIMAHVGRNSKRLGKTKILRAAQGLTDKREAGELVFYPVRKDYRDFKFFAFVIDPTVTATGHVSMIHAASADELAAHIAKVPSHLKVVTDKGSKLYHKAMGDYDYERTLHDNYIDASLRRAGIDNDYVLESDPQIIVNKILNQHHRMDSVLARETIRASNERTFRELEQLGSKYTEIATSQLGGSNKAMEKAVDNPFENYIKTALNISSMNEHPLLTGFNTAMDGVFTGVVNTLKSMFPKVNTTKDLDALNDVLREHGLNPGYEDAMMAAYANASPDRGALSAFVRRSNSIITSLALGTDPFHGIANVVGNNVLLGFELNNLTKAIKSANPEIAGRLSQLGEVSIPGSNGVKMLAPSKMVAAAMKDWIGPARKDILDTYTQLGFNPSFRDQIHSIHQDLVITGTENALHLESKLAKATEKFRDIVHKPATLSEEMNRFITVHVAKQITDLAEAAGIYTRNESLATINTFLNRVQGNITASQRPLMFQGPVGMAIGLFQTYQFNLLQQMFRTVSEGKPKDALMLLGLQGSIFGMNGMPAYNFINTHLVGNAAGNTDHTDITQTIGGIAPREAFDWIMYGTASNLPKLVGLDGTNLYTRGDINPRQLTILPSSLDEIPMVRAGTAVWNLFAGTMQQLAAGAPVPETIIQAFEHNSLSRPLAGLAQVSQAFGEGGQVYGTDTRGKIIGSNDLLSFSSLVRIAGGRPMDESATLDRYFRMKAYEAKDSAKMDNLRVAVRKSVINGNTLEGEQYAKFAEEYAKAGGKARQFNKFIMNQYEEANTTNAEKLAAQLSNPYAQRMQEFMRGRTIRAEDLDPNSFMLE